VLRFDPKRRLTVAALTGPIGVAFGALFGSLMYMEYMEYRFIAFLFCLSGAFAAGLIACWLDGVRVACDKNKEKKETPHPLGPARTPESGSSDWEYKRSLIRSITNHQPQRDG
jgi:hypothetical protein